MFAQVMMVKSMVFMNAPSHIFPVSAVILRDIRVAMARMGTMGMSTIYPSAISDCHITPLARNSPYCMAMTRMTPNTLKKMLMRVVAQSGIFLVR